MENLIFDIMKKLFKVLLVSCFAVMLSFNANSQNVFSKGTSVLGFGLGLNDYMGNLVLPPIAAHYDHGIADFGKGGSLGIGGYLGAYGYKEIDSDYSHSYFRVIFGPALTYHFNGFPNVRSLELYARGVLGPQFQIRTHKQTDVTQKTTTSFGFNLQVGGKWWFNNALALYAGFGYGVSFFELGLDFKL